MTQVFNNPVTSMHSMPAGLTQSIVNKTVVMILAGGEGKRLWPLTSDRAKPAVPFGGRYRLIDFVLSNFINSGFYRIKVLTQYKSDSLLKHLASTWQLAQLVGQSVEAVPAQMRVGNTWYRGNADAIYQNLNLIADEQPPYLCIFGADHIYKMDVRQMLDVHIRKGADLTVAAIPVPKDEAHAFGIIEIDENGWMVGFEEKPKANPKTIPGDPTRCLASMGNYIFTTPVLVDELLGNAARRDTTHDFGRDVIERAFKRRRVAVYDFATNVIPGEEADSAGTGYWRDVGTLSAYYEASLDLVSVSPQLNLYNHQWPIHSASFRGPPAKFVFANDDEARVGRATDSLVTEGCIISGGHIHRSILFPWTRVNSFSSVEDSILFEGVEIGRRAKVRRAILEKGVILQEGATVGFDLDHDRARFYVAEDGQGQPLVVVPKFTVVKADGGVQSSLPGIEPTLQALTDPDEILLRRLRRAGLCGPDAKFPRPE